MEKSSIVLDRGKEPILDINKCIICQKPGSLVSTENGRIKIIEAAKIRNDEVYERLASSYHYETSSIIWITSAIKIMSIKSHLKELR